MTLTIPSTRRAWLALAAKAALAGGLPFQAAAATGTAAAARTSRSPAAEGPAIEMPPLPLRERRLANGLQVIAIPERGGGMASIQVWYRVGAKDDPPGRSGFAHLFEHMMFKSTRAMKSEMLDRLTEDVGGGNNAFTAEDMTVYHEDVPANHLERLLWAEAERMANLQVDEANFASERAVVQEEFRQGVLADPYGLFLNAFPQEGFEVHPYKRPVIGSIADLDAASLDDVRAFHRTYYRPDNALLIVAGDVDPPQLDAWVDRYFGTLTHPDTPVPRVTLREPARAENRRVALQAPNVPLPAVALVWKGPAAASEDGPALQVAAALLSAGDSSRLNEALVYHARIAQSTGFSANLHADAGLLTAYAVAAGGGRTGSERALAGLEEALLREIGRLARGPIPAAEIEKVRTGLLTTELIERQTPSGKALAVGEAVLLHGDARFADRKLSLLNAVGAADVQRVLGRYLLEAKRVTITYTDDAKRSGGRA